MRILGFFPKAWLLFGILILAACAIPNKVSQLSLEINKKIRGDSVLLNVNNPSHSPIRLMIYNHYDDTNSVEHVIISPFGKFSTVAKASQVDDITIAWRFGDPTIPITNLTFELPFKKGKKYSILQGFNGKYSHSKSSFSRYAIDFGMQKEDTVCAAADGYVVGVVNSYSVGRRNIKWQPYANFITIYHPKSNLYSQYVHLAHLGNLVEVGDTIQVGQPIGLSGNTGYTDTPHLHFNVLIANESSLESTPYNFKSYKGSELQKGDYAKH